jgi:hypothetical protein
MAGDYKAFKQAGLVTEADQKVFKELFIQYSNALDGYRLALLNGEPTDGLVNILDNVRRDLLIRLATYRSKQ